MKKNILVVFMCTMLLLISSMANSAQGPYISGMLGVAILSDSDLSGSELSGVDTELESDTGFALGVAAGYAYGNNIRVEAELNYQKNDLDELSFSDSGLSIDLAVSGDFTSLNLMLNGYYDFVNDSAFTPFVFAGIGASRVEINDFTPDIPGLDLGDIDDDDTVFAYQLGIGGAYAISEKTYLEVKYRYLDTSDPEFDSIDYEYSSHSFFAGLRFHF